MKQLTPCDYWVIGVPEGVFWCNDSMGVHSNKHSWKKKIRQLPGQLVGSDADLLNLTLIDPTNESEGLEEGFSNGQKQIFEEVEIKVIHCGTLNLTGNTMLLTEQEQEEEEERENTTCPAQTEKDEHGVERYWPAINVGKYGRTQTYSLFCSMVLIAMGDFMLPLRCK